MPKRNCTCSTRRAARSKKPELPVIFRVFPNGEVIALFPTVIATNDPNTFNSYMHVGQHGAADHGIVERTRLAKPSEYSALLKELRAIGYGKDEKLVIKKKITYAMYIERRKALGRY